MAKELNEADIRNTLQAPLTALDLLSQGEEVPKAFIEKAKKDLDKAIRALNAK